MQTSEKMTPATAKPDDRSILPEYQWAAVFFTVVVDRF